MQTVPQDVLASEFELNLVQASTGKRFLNLIIDTIAYYALFFLLSILMFVNNPEAAEAYANDAETASSSLMLNLAAILLYVLYFFATEALFKGKTLGKLITGTRAVYENDGSHLSPKTAFTRALSRLVPFEPFSALGNPSYPWHDKWTDTIVIDEKQSVHL